MISIRNYNGKWRVQIKEEEFEFETRQQLDQFIKEILNTKELFGKLNNRGERID